MKESKLNQNFIMDAHVSDKPHNKEGDKDLQDDTTTAAAPSNSRLSILLACREMTPRIMEHEKAILVMKEHDYAGVPELTRMAPLLHTLASAESTADTTDSTSLHDNVPSTIVSKNTSTELLLSVRNALADNRREVLTGGSEGLMLHFKEMISLQSILLHELQEQIQIKDIESNTVHREKEQLEARLERMARRMSILQKHSKDKSSETSPNVISDEATPPESTPLSSPLRPDCLTRLTRSENPLLNTSPGRRRKSRSRSSSTEPTRRISRLGTTTTTPMTNSLEISHRAVNKRDLNEEDNDVITSSSKRHRSSSDSQKTTDTLSLLRTELFYDGLHLDLPISNDNNNGGRETEQPFATPTIRVPTWRTILSHLNKGVDSDNNVAEEETSDDVYIKRHSKLEADEKRRKRWDAQRIREQFQHKQLMKRYMMKEGLPSPNQEKKKEKLTTFQPKLDNLEGIELSDTVVVSGFGRPLPKLPANPFHLPNFNPHTAASRGGKGKLGRLRQNSSTNNSIGESSSHVT